MKRVPSPNHYQLPGPVGCPEFTGTLQIILSQHTPPAFPHLKGDRQTARQLLAFLNVLRHHWQRARISEVDQWLSKRKLQVLLNWLLLILTSIGPGRCTFFTLNIYWVYITNLVSFKFQPDHHWFWLPRMLAFIAPCRNI